uniref:Uncharacterized protein n=1 Tax=Oryza nivara TaxID=4536 RepID=A0A0E0I955_ORYNI
MPCRAQVLETSGGSAPQLHLLLHSPPTAVSPFPQEATTAIYTSLLSAHGSSHSRGFLGGVECRSSFWVMWSVHMCRSPLQIGPGFVEWLFCKKLLVFVQNIAYILG